MVYWIFGYYYVCGNGNFFRVSRRTYTDILNRICNSDHRKICIACNFCQFRICRFYNCYNFLLTGNCNDKSKFVYYSITADNPFGAVGVAVSFCRFICSMVDVSSY